MEIKVEASEVEAAVRAMLEDRLGPEAHVKSIRFVRVKEGGGKVYADVSVQFGQPAEKGAKK